MLNQEHLHIHIGTTRDLLSDGTFMQVVEAIETFNQGSPFTLCSSPALGEGDINLTAAVRKEIPSGRWIPESGIARLSVSGPANGVLARMRFKIPLDPGLMSEIHLRLDSQFLTPGPTLERTVDLLHELANDLDCSYLYAHESGDELLQDTTSPGKIKSLTGETPAVPVERAGLPGRTIQVGPFVLSCRWIMAFGSSLASTIGYERLRSCPAEVQELPGPRFMIRLYEDPLTSANPQSRQIQSEVREHLCFECLVSETGWQPVARRDTQEFPPISETNVDLSKTSESPSAVNSTGPITLDQTRITSSGETPRLLLDYPFHKWASLYDTAPPGLPGESEFYAEQARAAAGRVLQIGCANGRVLLALAKTGVPVVGIDKSPEVLDYLRQRLASESSALRSRTQLVQADVSELGQADFGRFAAAFIPFRGINRVTSPKAIRAQLQRIHDMLNPGGLLVFNTFFPTPNEATLGGKPVSVLAYSGTNPSTGGDYVIRDTLRANEVKQRLSVTRQVLDLSSDGTVTSERYIPIELRYYYPGELSYLLELVGFECAIFGGFDGEPLTRRDQEVVVVCRRR
ncbi:MAG: class I SAM-dependent methyltransferase [Myxococcales bacterium]|nr:class I SAM-dependent methyltransferase [Myxococcales bacterium]